MGKLEDVDPDELRSALADAETPKAAKRLMVALSYVDGDAADDIAARFGIPRSTVYYWLDRFESEPIEEAVLDEPRPGRPTKLDDEEWHRLRGQLDAEPTQFGLDADEWTPAAVRDHIESQFGVSYSEGHVRRLLREGTL
jgi:transposase